jgi:hypothetical protein
LDCSTESQEWANRLHFANINPISTPVLPPTFPIPPPPQAPAENRSTWDLITGDIHLIRDATECQQLRDVAAEDAKKDHSSGWEKIPELVQQMILKLSATSDENLPASPCEMYLWMLKQSKALGVAMVINIELSIRGCQVEVPTTMANAIRTGNFRANSLLVAHPFSIFNVPYIDQTWVHKTRQNWTFYNRKGREFQKRW